MRPQPKAPVSLVDLELTIPLLTRKQLMFLLILIKLAGPLTEIFFASKPMVQWQYQFAFANITNQINLFRIAFLLERMCPPSYGLGAKFNETVKHSPFSNFSILMEFNSISTFMQMRSTIFPRPKEPMSSWIHIITCVTMIPARNQCQEV